MNYENATLLKKHSVQIPQNTNLGINNLITCNSMNVYLPAGTLLESGNVRIPFDTVENNESILEKIDDTVSGSGACNNQNVILFSDQNNNIFSTIPSNLENIPIDTSQQVCYCLVPKNSDLKMNYNLDIKLNKDFWCTLSKGIKVKFLAGSEVEFRVNGNWYRIKLIKDEFYRI